MKCIVKHTPTAFKRAYKRCLSIPQTQHQDHQVDSPGLFTLYFFYSYYAKEEKLYVKNSWDRVIWYGLEKHLSVSDINIILHDLGLTPLLK